MSIQYTMTALCDGCGAVLEYAPVNVGEIDATRWAWRDKWKKEGILSVERVRRQTKLYYKQCADGAPPPK
jgi:hypothetical protein